MQGLVTMCSSGASRSTTTAGTKLNQPVRNVYVRDRSVRDPDETEAQFIERQKAATQRFVNVEDRGQFKYDAKGDVIPDEELQKRISAMDSVLNVQTTNMLAKNTPEVLSFNLPGKLKIKRNWSINSPTMKVEKMNTDMPSLFAPRKANYRVGFPRS